MHFVFNMRSTLCLFAIVYCVDGGVIDFSKMDLDTSNQYTINSTTKMQFRIVGGYTISILESPWMVAILYRSETMCGGSIISESKILSAAHCTYGLQAKQFSIRAGSSQYNTGGQLLSLSKIINHPKYTSAKLQNDISILFLKSPLRLSKSVATIGIMRKSSIDLVDGIKVMATGWGKTCEFNCDVSITLRAVKVPLIGNKRCGEMFKKYKNQFSITNSMLCAGLNAGGKDSCQGDSGGPLTYNNTLIGIVSFGIGCAQPRLPGVYTRVDFFRKWINRYL